MAVTFKLTGFNADATAKRLYKNDKVGIFAAETAARMMNDYVPMDSGTLSSDYETRPFEVEYLSPYAHRLFNGEGFNFSKEKHTLATSHWDEAMKKAKGEQLAKEIQDFIGRGS